MFCSKCGKQASADGRFCADCGASLDSSRFETKNEKPGDSVSPVVKYFGGLLLLLLLIAGVVDSVTRTGDRPTETTDQRREKLLAKYDPPSSKPLTAREHLERGRALLAQIDINGDLEVADTLTLRAAEHAGKAKEDPKLKRQADVLMKKMADKAADLVKMQTWQSNTARSSADILCRAAIALRLNASATVDGGTSDVQRLTGQPGQFLVRHTVDSGRRYACQVRCFGDRNCNVIEVAAVQ